MMTFKADARKAQGGLQVDTEARGFHFVMDEPVNMGGTDAGMNPVEAVLCALGACQTIVAASFAKANQFHYEEFHVEVEGDLDPAGMMGDPNVRRGFQEIRFTMHIKTDETQERCNEFADFIESRCPVGDIVANSVKLVRAGVVRE